MAKRPRRAAVKPLRPYDAQGAAPATGRARNALAKPASKIGTAASAATRGALKPMKVR